MLVVGIEKIDYVSKKTGLRVYGVKLHCTEPILRNGDGVKVREYYCPKDIAGHVVIGDEVKVYFDEYQRVDMIEVE